MTGTKILQVVLLLPLLVLLYPCGKAYAVPAAPVVHELTQLGGTKFKARQWGDEHRHGWETVDGYAIGFDESTKNWKYITLDKAGHRIFMQERVGIDPPPAGIQKHIERKATMTPTPNKPPSTGVRQ